MILGYIMIFIMGLIFGSFFCTLGFRLPINKPIVDTSYCSNCDSKLKLLERIPLLSYIFQFGKCKHCKCKIPIIYPIFELLTGLLFVISYISFKDSYPTFLNVIFGLLFVSSCIIIIICDIKYMIIPNEILIFFGIILVPLKMMIIYKINPGYNFMEMSYEFLFIILDGIYAFVCMFIVRILGDFLLKKETMGGGDIKMMAYISMIMGFKTSIIVIFVAAFLALPLSIINMYKNKSNMIPFGPYLAISSMILFLLKIDLNTIVDFIS